MSHVRSLTKYVGHFVDQLYQSGLRHVVISPGSRSTPLSLTLAEYGKFKIGVDIDERSAAFYALGIAKETKKAVALVCSSGTAAANYYPAIIEAYYSRIPLVVLTADRPHELRDVGAPQAIDQVKLFGSYVKWFHEMALPEDTPTMLQYARNQADRVIQKSLFQIKGPVHLNFPFREPLVPDFSVKNMWRTKTEAVQHLSATNTSFDEGMMKVLGENIKQYRKGLIVCGPHDYPDLNEKILHLAQKWQLPILADPLSGLRSSGETSYIMDCYDSVLKTKEVREKFAADFMIRFGAMPVSKAILQLLQEQDMEQFIVDEEVTYRDPSVNRSHYLYGNPENVASELADISYVSHPDWLQVWKKVNRAAKSVLADSIGETNLTEGEAVLGIREVIPANSILFAGNSMPIRDVDTFWFTNEKQVAIYANRGANGIDGVISAAAGTGINNKHVTLIIGDLSLLHSMNGLLLTKRYARKMTMVVINNQGGGIFSFLPQAEKSNEHYEKLFGTPQDIAMKNVASLYGMDYQLVTQWNEYLKALEDSYQEDKVTLIEIHTDRYENVKWHQAKWKEIQQQTLAILKEYHHVYKD